MPQAPPSSVGPPAGDRLDSWKEIGAYLKRDERTVRRWEREGLPVYRHLHTKKATVYSYKSEIDAWWKRGRDRLELQDTATPRRRRRVWWIATGLALLAVGSVAGNVAWLRSRWSSRRAAGEIASIAVLPLQNLSGKPEQDYLADGMTEALTTELARISALRVISRESAMEFKGVRKPLSQVAEELKVDAVVEGAVVREGSRVAVTARLIQVRPEKLLWAERYDRDLTSLLGLQNEVARAVASEIQAKLTPREKALLATTRRVDPQAYEAYVKGHFFLETVTPEGISRAVEYFSRAIDIDPTYAPAYAGLADAYNRAAIHDYRPAREAYPAAKVALARAVQLDDTLAEARVLSGVIRFRFDWDWAGAERDLKSGLALDPNSSRGHLGYSTYLFAMGHMDDAVRVAMRNVELDPLTIQRYTDLAWKLSRVSRYDEAIAQLKKAQEIVPDSGEIYGILAMNYAGKLMLTEALTLCDKALAKHVGSFAIGDCGRIYVQSGKRREAIDLLKRLLAQEAVPQYQVARLYDALGNKEQAVQWLLQAYEARASEMCFLRIDTVSEALRSDPRFQAVLLKMNFPSWTDQGARR